MIEPSTEKQHELSTRRITLRTIAEGLALFGPRDTTLEHMQRCTTAKLWTRDDQIVIEGTEKEVEHVGRLLEVLLSLVRTGIRLTPSDVAYAIHLSQIDQLDELLPLTKEDIGVTVRGRPIKAKTLAQRHYIALMRTKDLVFGVGPAGTGKTYLAVVQAVRALKEGSVKRIVLTRPAVEAGESLGFLPGDLKEKADPYMRPIYDALHDVLGSDPLAKAIERGTIEIAPLAYMRGRTLDDSFILVDEAQNTTSEQMKMCLTRIGMNAKMVVTGDPTQTDLPRGKGSGLTEALWRLSAIKEIGFVTFEQTDIVRHTLVQKIVQAYATDVHAVEKTKDIEK